MIELSEPNGATQTSAPDSAKRWDDTNKTALHFMFGAQRMILEEMVFAAYATLDRVRTETHLLGEFASKLGAAHSVQDCKTMGSGCRQHQLEFIRRDSDRIFRHGERVIESASKLFESHPLN